MKVIVKNFLSHHVVNQSEKAFKTMEVIATAIPYLIADMLSDIAIVVNQAQQAKGSGVDDNLRYMHINVLCISINWNWALHIYVLYLFLENHMNVLWGMLGDSLRQQASRKNNPQFLVKTINIILHIANFLAYIWN